MSVKLLKTTTDGAVSQKSNEIHLKLNDCQLNRYFVDTSGLLATWPEFWAIGLSFLDIFAFSLDTLLAHSEGGAAPSALTVSKCENFDPFFNGM